MHLTGQISETQSISAQIYTIPGTTGPTIDIEPIENGTRLIINDTSGTKTVDVLNGKDGVDGKDGKDGADGQPGTQGEKGETGAQGIQGDKGDKGDTGATGANGKDGKDGADGKSAYQIAQDHGFEGTEEEWLESLKGVYVGSGEMPDGYNIQIDPSGEPTSVGGIEIDGTAEVGQTIVVKAVDENGKPTEWAPASKRTVHRGRIIKLLDHVFDEDIADTGSYDDGIGDMAIDAARIFTTDENGAPLKIRRLWYQIYWGAGSKDAATTSPRFSVPSVGLCGINTEYKFREMFIGSLHHEKRLCADRGSMSNNITDGQYRYGYVDWEKILCEEFHTAQNIWKGNAATSISYPAPTQVAYVLGVDYGLAAYVSFPGTIKAGTTYKVWVEVAE